jgi:hypothetical protein
VTAVRALRLLVVLLLLLPGVGSLLADSETAQFVAQRADKALQAKAWADAESLYRKALEEDPKLLRARLGLAEALLGGGQRAAGLTELRRFAEEAGAAEASAGLAPLVAKAKKRLAELDADGTDLEKRIDGHVAALLAFAGRWKEKDPDVAATALDQLLLLKPGHEKATELRAGFEKKPSAATTQLFNGKDDKGWTWFKPPTWTVREGVIVAKAVNSSLLARTDTVYSGQFDVLMECRFTQFEGSNSIFALCPCWKSDDDMSRLGLRDGKVAWDEVIARERVEGYGQIAFGDLKPPLDVRLWNIYEMRYRKSDIFVFVNGKEVFKMSRPATRAEGFVALLVSNCAVEVRRVELVQR